MAVTGVRERPSSCKEGDGSEGGGVTVRFGREGDEALEYSSPLDCEASPSSRTDGLLDEAEGRSRSGRRWIRLDRRLEKRFVARLWEVMMENRKQRAVSAT